MAVLFGVLAVTIHTDPAVVGIILPLFTAMVQLMAPPVHGVAVVRESCRYCQPCARAVSPKPNASKKTQKTTRETNMSFFITQNPQVLKCLALLFAFARGKMRQFRRRVGNRTELGATSCLCGRGSAHS